MKIKKIIVNIKSIISQNIVLRKVLTNSGWLVGNTVFSMIIGVFVTAIVARYFGSEKYGIFNYAFSFNAIFTSLSTLGLSTLTVKSIVDKEYEEGTILFTSFIMRMISGLFITIASMVIIRILEPDDKVIRVLVFIMSITMVARALEVIEYWIQAHQKAKISSIIRMSVYVVTAILKILVVVFNRGMYEYALVYLVDALLVGLMLLWSYFKYRKEQSLWRFNVSYAVDILKKCWYLVVSGMMVTLYMRVDQIMLGYMLTDKSELGVYSAAVAIAAMWYFVPMAIITSFSPIIMSQKKTNQTLYLNTMQLLYCIIAWISIAFAILIIIFSKLIIAILYGPEFMEASKILNISIWAGTFALLGSTRSVWLVNEGLQRYTITYTFAGFMINLILNLILIPIWGGYGAAVATLAAQMVANVFILALFKKTRISTIMILKAFSPIRTIRLIKEMLKKDAIKEIE